jgi:hypothetical protein
MYKARPDERAHRQHREHPRNDASDPTLGSCHKQPMAIDIVALLTGTIDARER